MKERLIERKHEGAAFILPSRAKRPKWNRFFSWLPAIVRAWFRVKD